MRSATDGDTFPLDTPVVASAMWLSGGGVQAHKNGVAVGGDHLGQVEAASGFQGYRIGTYRDADNRWWPGYIGELVIVDREMSWRERNEVVDLLLLDKWTGP